MSGRPSHGENANSCRSSARYNVVWRCWNWKSPQATPRIIWWIKVCTIVMTVWVIIRWNYISSSLAYIDTTMMQLQCNANFEQKNIPRMKINNVLFWFLWDGWVIKILTVWIVLPNKAERNERSIGRVVGVPARGSRGRGFDSRPGQTNGVNVGILNFLAKHSVWGEWRAFWQSQ